MTAIRKKVIFCLFVFSLLSPVVLSHSSQAQDDGDFTLTIMHTNDTHAHHEADRDGNGGVAIMTAVVHEIRSEVDHTLLLDAGDRFTGSVYHSFYQGWDSAQVMNLMGYDAMVLGSYEFTHGPQRLADFVGQLNFPVVVSNVDFSGSRVLDGVVDPYDIIEIDGEQIGIIGITQGDSRIRPIPEISIGTDYVGIAQSMLDELIAQDINKIILISHLGYFDDLQLASQLTGVDIIVGGDTNTLLSNSLPDAEGPYPAEVPSTSDEPILVVQAWYYNQVLGRLNVVFNSEGVLESWDGDSILLTSDIEPDPQMTALITRLRAAIEETFFTGIIGETEVYLEGDEAVCRFEECNLGNLITDAMRDTTGAQIAFQNGGGIRASIDAGEISAGEVFDVLPFNNTFVIFDIEGADIIDALENSVSRVQDTEGTGRFLQVSGLRFSWDGSQEVGSRIVSIEIMNSDGDYEVLDPDEVYSVVTNDYLFAGGDDYAMFATNNKNSFDFGRTVEEVTRAYITKISPFTIAPVEGRITRVDR